MNLDPDLDLSLDFDGEALMPARPRSVMTSRKATEKKGFTPPSPPVHRTTAPPQADPAEERTGGETRAKTEQLAKPKPTSPVKQPEVKDPWKVHNPKDLWDFFGMWLSILAAIQAYASYLIAGAIYPYLEEQSIPIPLLIGAVALAFLVVDVGILLAFRKRHHQAFIAPLAFLSIVSVSAAVIIQIRPLFLS